MTARNSKALATSVLATFAALAQPVAAAASPTAGAAPAEDIRDIRALILILPWWYWLAAGVAATLILAVAFAGVRYWRRSRTRALTPEQRALRALNEAEALARAGHCHEWADAVAHTLRTALATRLEREACPETTSELAAIDWSMLRHGSSIDAPQLVELLSTCDLTRFALGRLDPSALLAETQRARAWITQLFATPESPSRTAAQATSLEATQ